MQSRLADAERPTRKSSAGVTFAEDTIDAATVEAASQLAVDYGGTGDGRGDIVPARFISRPESQPAQPPQGALQECGIQLNRRLQTLFRKQHLYNVSLRDLATMSNMQWFRAHFATATVCAATDQHSVVGCFEIHRA